MPEKIRLRTAARLASAGLGKNCQSIFFFLSFLMFFFIFERERQSTSGVGAERDGDTESKAGSRLWAVSTESDVGLELANSEIMT